MDLRVSSTLLLILQHLVFTSRAQLVGCDAISCPIVPPDRPQCIVGNATLTEIGVANITTSLTRSPFTWTIGTELIVKNSPDGDVTAVFNRNFYLGTPPLDQSLSGNNDVGGCGIFFDGISEVLNFPAIHFGPAIGTCSDALGADCAKDLLSQAQQAMSAGPGIHSVSDCEQLASKLRDSPPKTCNLAVSRGTWGNVEGRGLLARDGAVMIERGNCNPTTGLDYQVRLVANFTRNLENPSDVLHLDYGITPVLTLVYLDAAANNSGSKPTSTAQLTCLKVVEHVSNAPNQFGSGCNSQNAGFEELKLVIFLGVLGVVSRLMF